MKKTLLLVAGACLLSTCRSASALTSWWAEPWTADEKPYREARTQVDRVRGRQSALSALVSKWQPLTQGKPFDQVAQYRWGYALYWLTRTRTGEGDDPSQVYREYGAIREALYNSTFGDDEVARKRNHSYEFNRLRFWVERRSGFPLADLGERLLKRNPNDAETQMGLLKIRMSNCPPQKKAGTVALWRKVAARYPNDPTTTYWLARIYNAAYRADYRAYGDPADARKANDLYLRFLREAPNTARYKQMRKLSQLDIGDNQRALSR